MLSLFYSVENTCHLWKKESTFSPFLVRWMNAWWMNECMNNLVMLILIRWVRSWCISADSIVFLPFLLFSEPQLRLSETVGGKGDVKIGWHSNYIMHTNNLQVPYSYGVFIYFLLSTNIGFALKLPYFIEIIIMCSNFCSSCLILNI